MITAALVSPMSVMRVDVCKLKPDPWTVSPMKRVQGRNQMEENKNGKI